METIKIWNDDPSERQTADIAAALEEGKIVIMPTDTLYGITCDALNPKAIETICRMKHINPEKSNLSILCSDIAMAADYAKIDNQCFRLLKDNTPGPFTFLFRALHSLPKAFKGRKIVGVRIPDSTTARMVVEALGHPVLSTSIEYEDEDYARNPELIAETYDTRADLMVEGEDGGRIPSAIIDCTGSEPEIIREGPIEFK